MGRLVALVAVLAAGWLITPAAAAVQLRRCGGAQCGTVTRALDPQRPQGRTIAVAFRLYRAQAKAGGPPIVAVEGGPGYPSTGTRAEYRAKYAASALEQKIFDARPLPAPVQNPNVNISLQSNWTRRAFEDGVRQVKEYIAAGDCYQVVLSQRFSAKFTGEPLQIYRALRAVNPSPYMFFLRLGAETVVGASPEMLVRCHGQRLDYRPIAGTRKRGATETEDWMLSEDLRSDEKEIAEHMMLVDLGRNDLGRVSDYGSVRVEDLMRVERYSHVQHLETSLRSRLRDGLDRFDALASCFPAGTVTGAPKIRAMEIIRGLEPDRRGLYAGSVLYMDYADNLDSCIAIRTIVLRDGEAFVQAGAGIVADSIPEHEYAETVNKARAMFRAIEIAQRGL